VRTEDIARADSWRAIERKLGSLELLVRRYGSFKLAAEALAMRG